MQKKTNNQLINNQQKTMTSQQQQSAQLESNEIGEPPSRREKRRGKPPFAFLSRLFSIFKKEEAASATISSREELIDEVRLAKTNDLIAADALSMIEGVMEVDHLQSRDIMLSVSQIQFIHRDNSFHEILAQVLESGHSRYPVNDENRDDIDGILHAKDLLKYIGNEDAFNIDDVIRPPLYSPETQRLNELLTEFKKSRNHMAVIVDEYGGISGLVTMEDILEQIVGEIDDEHDREEVPNIHRSNNNLYTVNALTPIKEFNSYFNASEEVSQFDTIGGLVSQRIGKIPNPNEKLITSDFKYTVLTSDGRRIQSLEVEPLFTMKNIDSKDQDQETSTKTGDNFTSSTATNKNAVNNTLTNTGKKKAGNVTPTIKPKSETRNNQSNNKHKMNQAPHNKHQLNTSKNSKEHSKKNNSKNNRKSEKAA